MSKTMEEKMLETEDKRKIKTRFLTLFSMVKEIDETLNVSQAKLAKKFHVSEQTFKDTYKTVDSKKATNCNPILVINFAHQYGIDPYDIMFSDIPIKNLFEDIKAHRNEKNMQSQKKAQLHYDERIYPLSSETHSAYFGVFYGYTIDHKPTSDTILAFRLHIYETEDHTPVAEYSYYGECNRKEVFTGIPYFISFKNAIAIEMTATGNRRYQYLYFNADSYGADQITYKNGICVRTSRTSKKSEPDAKSFIITGHELPEDVLERYVPGLLKMTGESFYVLNSELNKLIEINPKISPFLYDHKNEIENIDDALYKINEAEIIKKAESKDKAKQIEAFEILTEIKAHSLATNRVMYRNTDVDYNFFKNLDKD